MKDTDHTNSCSCPSSCESNCPSGSHSPTALTADETNADSRGAAASESSSHWRPIFILLFAAILILLSSRSKAAEQIAQPVAVGERAESSVKESAEPDFVEQDANGHGKPAADVPGPLVSHATMTIELNGTTHVITPTHSAAAFSGSVTQASHVQGNGTRRSLTQRAASRPAYVQLSAHLANFDSDADPDGWRAELVVRDRQDRAIEVRGQAEFQLTPRVPTGDFHNYIDADTRPLTWSENVVFDETGVAHFKLPLRQQLRPLFGWSSAIYPATGLRSTTYNRQALTHRRGIHGRYKGSRQRGTAITSDWRNNLGKPDFGELRVKLSIPTEGVFEAVSVTPIRPSVLVDTHWPYR
ncbi:hypothetical protein [Planctomycetes bacterium K23_9]|uniref:Uncharacterized protein n=1 Tax=Stieleria marina TaxID=1930275 RepID=A0A517NSD3_9BACT|nr:hypothetical protein K239x_19680 [Planctomycetes bacterium K23_9]